MIKIARERTVKYPPKRGKLKRSEVKEALKDLTDKGLLTVVGKGRGSRYVPKK